MPDRSCGLLTSGRSPPSRRRSAIGLALGGRGVRLIGGTADQWEEPMMARSARCKFPGFFVVPSAGVR
jgi:hypothetical protein